VTVALLKGRANYVCILHLNRALEQGRFTSSADAAHLRRIARFAKTTSTGDKADLSAVPENSPIWNWVTSTRDNCPGTDCEHFKACFLTKARQAALQADVVVVNHHLFFADIALKDAGIAEILPLANTVIFDEAHQLPDTATLFFGERISTTQILDLCREILAEGLACARDAADWVRVISRVENAARDLRLTFAEDSVKCAVSKLDAAHPLFEQLANLIREISALAGILLAHSERSEMLMQYCNQVVHLVDQLAAWMTAARDEGDTGHVLWIEVFSLSMQLHKTPLSVAEIFTRHREDGPRRSWIFTSATLAVRNNFDYFSSQLGLESVRSQSWPSPFDYPSQGLLYVPDNLPLPNSPLFSDAVADAILPLIEAAGGRTFVLCTTLKAVDTIAARLQEAFVQRGWTYPLYIQGQASRTELLERFRKVGNGVLVGSQSFWEGVDVRGEALSLVVVDKLPFAPPDDPVLEARLAALEKAGKNGFMDYQLPEAIMNLKQGSGRLIRDEMDKGVLMICDTRIISRQYGRRIWQSLPPFSRTRSQEDAQAFFSKFDGNDESGV
jgi:ATP-dependent DNA helicase DinG